VGKALAYEPPAKRARGGQGAGGGAHGGPGGSGAGSGRGSAGLPGPGPGMASGGPSGGAAYGASARRSVDGYGPAREGEQVAALTEDEDGSVQWILAVVHKYYAAEVPPRV